MLRFLSGLLVYFCFASAAFADELFNVNILATLSERLESRQCYTECTIDSWKVRATKVPGNASSGLVDRLFVFESSNGNCGSAGCAEAYVLMDETRLYVLKSGFAVSVTDPISASEFPGPKQRASLRSIPRLNQETDLERERIMCANELFVEAVKNYREAAGLTEDQRDQALLGVWRMLNRVRVEAPTSLPALRLAKGASLGAIDINEVWNAAVRSGSTKPPQADVSATKTALANELLAQYGSADKIAIVAENADYAWLSSLAYGIDENGATRQYRCSDKLPLKNWHVVQSFKFDNVNSGDLWATLFVNDNGLYVLAFRGTKHPLDWTTNLSTIASIKTGQISDAKRLASYVTGQLGSVIFTGHSLGGRLANIARMTVGGSAVVFDTAPPSPKELVDAALNSNSQGSLIGFRAPGDPVSIATAKANIEIANYVGIDGVEFSEWLSSKTGREVVEDTEMLVAGSLQQHKIPQLALAMQYVKTVNPWVQAIANSNTQPDPDVASDPGLANDGQEVVAAESNNGSSGALCEETKTPLEGAPLKSLLWGAKISGTNVKGVKWDEYLAKGGDIGNTIFVNASGKETIGVYKITESHVCFSYGTVAKWNCKTVSACISGEAPWVITDLEGKQTSLVQYVEPYGFAPYHTSRWADLASKQQLAIPHETKPRQYTPIPPDMEATALELERLFSGPGLTSNVDQNSCQITITYKSPIAGNRDFTSGGWEWWLGSNTSGQNTVGVETQIYSVDLENYDAASSRQASALGNTTLNPIFGRSFFLRSIIQRTDNQTLNSDKSQAIGGFFFKGLNAQRISQLLQELSDVCAGRVKTFAQQAEVSKMPPQPERSTESHHCSSVDNDIARLQCFDAAFGDK